MNKNFFLHLTLIEDIGPHSIQKIMLLQRSDVQASDLYHLSASGWIQHFGFSESTATKIVAGLADGERLEKELELIEKHKVQLVTIIDEAYPSLLKEIHLPPTILYLQKQKDVSFPTKALAVVGARKANEYGKRAVQALVPDLVAAGYTIVSGGAMGIDAMAHEATLACGGKTIAILGSGLLKPYPHTNKKLFTAIIENGGIVASSYPLMMEPLPHNFPARNRIVTGLSQGCVVIQAAKKSGALISAHCALEQGREVFAVPGLFYDELSAGCHEIMQQGAKLVMSSADILSEFGESIQVGPANSMQSKMEQQSLFATDNFSLSPLVLSLSKDIFERKVSDEKYSDAQKQIIAACKQPASLEDIMNSTQLSFEKLQSELFNLQIDGVVSQDFSGLWIARLFLFLIIPSLISL